MTGPTARVLLTVDEYREELLTDLLATHLPAARMRPTPASGVSAAAVPL